MSLESEAVLGMLDRAGVSNTGTLVVHSGFRGLSRAGYRAEPFIEAILDRMSGGNVLMPAMTWRIVTPARPVWHEVDTPSHVGLLPELFRTRYAQRRSIHPTHSACAFGPASPHLVEGHEIDETPCPINSPWGRLVAHEAHILLLDTGFETCTALHHPEEIMAPSLYLAPSDTAETCRCTTRDGSIVDVRFRRHLRLDRDFPRYTQRLDAKGQLKSGDIAGVPWMAVTARDLMEDVFANLAAEPAAHIRSGVRKAPTAPRAVAPDIAENE